MHHGRAEGAEPPDVRVHQHDIVETVERVVQDRAVDADLDARAITQWRVVFQRDLGARDDADAEVLLAPALEPRPASSAAPNLRPLDNLRQDLERSFPNF